ncbi:ER membrane protein complex subunit 3 [Galdieria sulphuraria]|nr:ER membrane protein complex subunit 3 [Galdieria sulphuraria]
MEELVLSGQILVGVFLSITLTAFITVAMRAPLLSLFKTHPTPCLSSIRMAAILKRSVLTRTNAAFLPNDQFLCRKKLFIDETRGLLQQDKEHLNNDVPSIDKLTSLMKPHLLRTKVLENIANVGPQMALGAWIRTMFHGYVVCRLPFWVPERFRSMLQSGIEMMGESLDIRYVSGLSWEVEDMQFGSLPEEIPEMQTKMLMKQEKEQWKGMDYHWKLENIEEELLGKDSIK